MSDDLPTITDAKGEPLRIMLPEHVEEREHLNRENTASRIAARARKGSANGRIASRDIADGELKAS